MAMLQRCISRNEGAWRGTYFCDTGIVSGEAAGRVGGEGTGSGSMKAWLECCVAGNVDAVYREYLEKTLGWSVVMVGCQLLLPEHLHFGRSFVQT